MSNQTDETVIISKPSVTKKMNWLAISVTFSIVIAMSLACAAGYGYVQFSKIMTDLGQKMAILQTQTSSMHQHLDHLEKSVSDLKTAQENAKNEQPTAEQEKIAAELYSRLSSLNNKIDQLPILITNNAPVAEVSSEENASVSWWQKAWKRAWQSLRKIVVVRYIGSYSMPWVSPEEKSFLYQNLHAQMEAAMWGALHHDATVYQISLARAITWIQRYFVQNIPETNTIITELQALQKENVTGMPS